MSRYKSLENVFFSGAQEFCASEGSRDATASERGGDPPGGVFDSGAYMSRWPSNLGGPRISGVVEVPTLIDARFVEGVR